MRILQIIDSLEAGGAERMAVNYANALAARVAFSGLAATRAEGPLKEEMHPDAGYVFLRKRRTLDLPAVFRLRMYCRKNRVTHVQPHSSSFFTAFLLKLVDPKVRIIWHDHYGLSEFVESRETSLLRVVSRFFRGIIVVNYQLKDWAEKHLKCRNVIYLPNFTHLDLTPRPETELRGLPGKRILCLANLREQKNHPLLIRVAKRLSATHPDWTFHLVGKDFNDGYSDAIRSAVASEGLSEHVFLYGSRNDSADIIRQADICILTSKSEGLPVALLEYGLHRKAVVVTAVGEMPLIVSHGQNGFIVPSDDAAQYYPALLRLVADGALREALGNALHETIMKNNSAEAVVNRYLEWLQQIN